VEYQERGARWHLANLTDDHVPYIMPWHGTGIIPSMFGSKVHYPSDVNDDPAIKEPCLRNVSDIARLKPPDPHKDGLMPWVLEVMRYAKEHTEFPVVLTDMQSTLGCAGWMCGQTNLCVWMLEEPQAVKDLFRIITDAIIASVKAQKEAMGDALDESQGLQGVWAPEGVGVWLSDDDAVMQSPDLYEEFCVPEVSRVFTAFGKGILHYCGDNQNKVDRFRKIENLAAINTSCMGNFQLIRKLQESFGGKLPIIMQENAPIDVPFYFDHLFTEVNTMRGIIICDWAAATVGMKRNGGATSGRWDPLSVGREIVARVRRNTERMLNGEPILEKHYPVLPEDEAIHTASGH
jgi:uroporphyrinogen-III decarboxylase